MRVTERCPCGGQIEVTVTSTISMGRTEREREESEARKQLDTWRRAHKPCLKRLGEAALKPEDS